MNKNVPPIRTFSLLLACLLFTLFLIGCSHSAAHSSEATVASTATASHDSHSGAATSAESSEIAQNIPHYFDDPEKAKPFPKTLDPEKMKIPAAKIAYATARRIPEVLAQQPCYCYCDRGFGHGSLLGCHVDNHSAD